MKLAIADPPYPPSTSSWKKRRASRWYGRGLATSDIPADFHPEAEIWDNPATHRTLLRDLMDGFDGWALATCPDGIAAYGDLPEDVKIMAWVKPNGQPGSHRLRSCWEPVIVFPPSSRRSNRGGRGAVDDVFVGNAPRVGFVGAKPAGWVRWVLEAMSFDPSEDEVIDLFPGSGVVAQVLAEPQLRLGGASS